MKRKSILIDDGLVAAVSARLEQALEAGRKPRTAWTKQAVFKEISPQVQAMRSQGFSLEEIAGIIEEAGLRCTPEIISSYMSRARLGTPRNNPTKLGSQDKKSKREKSATSNRSTEKQIKGHGPPNPEQHDGPDGGIGCDASLALQPSPPRQVAPIMTEQSVQSTQHDEVAALPSPNKKANLKPNKNWMQEYT